MNSKDTISHIATLNTVEEVRALLEGESRSSVITAAEKRINELTAQAASTSDANSEGGNADAEEGTANTDVEDNDGADDTEEDDEDGDGADDTQEPPAPAPPAPVKETVVRKGRGGDRAGKSAVETKVNYQLRNPKGKASIGFQGRLYNREEVKDDQELMARMHTAGNSQVIRIG